MRKIADQIFELGPTELFLVIDMRGNCSSPLDGDQAGFHEQVKSAIFIIVVLQLNRNVVFVANCSRELSTILCNCSRDFFVPSTMVENRVADIARLMTLAISREVSSGRLTLTPDGMTSGATGFSEEEVVTAGRVARCRANSGLALQKAQISNESLAILFAHVAKRRHTALRNS